MGLTKCGDILKTNWSFIGNTSNDDNDLSNHVAMWEGGQFCIFPNISDYSNTFQQRQNLNTYHSLGVSSSTPRQCALNTICIGHLNLIQYSKIWTPEVIQRVVTIAIIMFFTLIGNITIVIVLTFSKYRKLTSRVNIFIINLAIGDLTVLFFTMTTEIIFVAFGDRWMLGPVLCKIMLYFQIVTLASTTFILTAMSYDRYLALCKPLKLGNITSTAAARHMIIYAWIMAFVFAIPQCFIFKQIESGIYPDGQIQYKCASVGYTAWWQRKLYFTFLTIYILLLPTSIICYCYINVVCVVWKQGKAFSGKGDIQLRRTNNKSIPKVKVRTIKMTLSIIFSFIMCWTPYFVVHLIHIWSEYKYYIPAPVYIFAETAALLNSALNPILYGFFNIKIKTGLFEVFCPQKLDKRKKCHQKSLVTEYVTMTKQGSSPAMNNNTGGRRKIMRDNRGNFKPDEDLKSSTSSGTTVTHCKSYTSSSAPSSGNTAVFNNRLDTVGNTNRRHNTKEPDIVTCNGSFETKNISFHK